ncbi:MAG: FAD:protein FMN transferase [Candidatus Marinimicrobia bacterium]|nr:FAD:protein FMN transferase [Candidatus Neomarinimicrobiota bacterium]
MKFKKVLLWMLTGLLLVSCAKEPVLTLRGETMGTFYTIKICGAGTGNEKARIQTAADSVLKVVNASLNTYDPESEISRFNEDNKKAVYSVSSHFMYVTEIADSVHRISGGAFDPGISRLVDLWGFGKETVLHIPDSLTISRNMEHAGIDNIQILKDGILKKHPGVKLDYAAIAKGYGVDMLFREIREQGFENVLVEIGGEVRAGGKCNGRPWRIGIAVPGTDNTGNRDFSGVIALQNMACATSGDYQQFYEIEGKRYSHLINPKTGYPIEHELTSVSVIAEKCIFADALATAAIVLGRRKGPELIESLEGVEAYFIYRDRRGGLQSLASTGWEKYRK